ncbi:pyrimidine dimer DNA glycosylase/endonuclease V [Arthrobacter sp. KK5.5]|uniref:pyrimidine dimer DNA glycosylase/endonuclease V n=1 Tax=Arthrobacter sp. KK5.5 TaxID=3373084 RepID=UPI003EE54F05
MRIWSLHPRYLDSKGLVACWRETLLAQKVLQGATAGYRNHPQLVRFRACPEPVAAIGAYLAGMADEAAARGYNFNRSLIVVPPAGVEPGAASAGGPDFLTVTRGQMDYERAHLSAKLAVRDPERLPTLESAAPDPHPLFRVVEGEIEPWEILG